jgi:hypothetical protein
MEYKTFETLMKKFIKIKEELDRVTNETDKSFLNEEHWNYPLGATHYESLFLDTITEAMGDKFEYIWYWCFDCDFGRDKNMNKKVKMGNKYVKFKTLKDLYNLIK